MDYVNLGKTDIKISKVTLGTMTFGEQVDKDTAHRIIDQARERGINFIDTAEIYPTQQRAETCGDTERIIGEYIKSRGSRDQMIIASKVAAMAPHYKWVRGGWSKHDKNTLNQVINEILVRLNTEYIDLFQLHWPDRNVPLFGDRSFIRERDKFMVGTPIEEVNDTLTELIKEGKIRAYGVSNESPWGLIEHIKQNQYNNKARVASLQNGFSLANRSFEPSMDEICFREKVSFLAYSPLSFGYLSGKYIENPDVVARMNLVDLKWSPRYSRPQAMAAYQAYYDLAKKHDMTLIELSLSYCYTRKFIDSTIIGVTTEQQLAQNLDVYDKFKELSTELLFEIDQIHYKYTNPAQ